MRCRCFFAILLLCHPCLALDIRADFGAVGDGVADDGPAFRAALARLNGAKGGVLTIPPGTYRILATAENLCLGLESGVTIQGVPGRSVIVADSDIPTDYRELLRVAGRDITIEGIGIERTPAWTGVALKIYPCADLTVSRVSFDGSSSAAAPSPAYASEIAALAGGVSDGIRFADCRFAGLQTAFFMTSASTATARNLTFERCRFSRMTGDALTFNAPAGTMTDIHVLRSSFADSLSPGPNALGGAAISLANVQRAEVVGCSFLNHAMEPLHIEDRTAHVLVSGNWFSACGTAGYATMANVINDSRSILLTGNEADQTTAHPAVFVSPGGPYVAPSRVLVAGNVFRSWPPHWQSVQVEGGSDVLQASNLLDFEGDPPAPALAPAPVPPPAPAPVAPDPARSLLDLHNAARSKSGLKPLAWSEALADAARAHSRTMADAGHLAHQGLKDGTMAQRATTAHYAWSALGENIGMGYATPADAMAGWLNSPPHRANILGGYVEMGAALATDGKGGKWWTVDFGSKK